MEGRSACFAAAGFRAARRTARPCYRGADVSPLRASIPNAFASLRASLAELVNPARVWQPSLRVPHRVQPVKGKACGAVLTRSSPPCIAGGEAAASARPLDCLSAALRKSPYGLGGQPAALPPIPTGKHAPARPLEPAAKEHTMTYTVPLCESFSAIAPRCAVKLVDHPHLSPAEVDAAERAALQYLRIHSAEFLYDAYKLNRESVENGGNGDEIWQGIESLAFKCARIALKCDEWHNPWPEGMRIEITFY